jgi:hypothetical protein
MGRPPTCRCREVDAVAARLASPEERLGLQIKTRRREKASLRAVVPKHEQDHPGLVQLLSKDDGGEEHRRA